MKNLELKQMETLEGNGFWGGFCTAATFVAILNGGANMLANGIAAGCFLHSALT